MSWGKSELGDNFEFVRNGVSIKQDESKGGIPITRIETIWNCKIDKDRFGYADIDDSNVKAFESYLLQPNDLLMTHINSAKHLGKTSIFEGDPVQLIHGMNLLCLRPLKERIDPKFVFFYFNSGFFKSDLQKISNQSVNQSSFSAGKLKTLKIPLPPLPIQKKIAAVLEKADNLRKQRQEQIKRLDDLLQATFLDMFGDPVTNPKGWDKLTINEICSQVTDGEHNTPKRETQGKLLLSARNVKNGYIDLEAGVDYVGESEYQRLKKRCGPEKDDILITCSGTIGRTSRVPEKLEFVLVRSVALLKLKKDVVIPDFVEGYFQTQGMFEIMKRRANSSSQANLFTGQIKELQIFKVPIGLQQRFGEISRKLKVEKGVFEEALEKDQDLFNSLMQKAFKGELVLS